MPIAFDYPDEVDSSLINHNNDEDGMLLSKALAKAQSIADLNDIFQNDATVKLDLFNDQVTIQGYQGTVTTDAIAKRVIMLYGSVTDESKQLAGHLAKNVFSPLKTLVESPENQCSIYQISVLTRAFWSPSQAPEFGTSIALRHAMVLGVLDDKYMTDY